MMSRWRPAMRRALAIDGAREGVPMLLALCDERPDGAHAGPPDPSDDGTGVAKALDACRHELADQARDDDLGVVITMLAVVAYDEMGEHS